MLNLTLCIGDRDQVVEAKQNARYLGVWLDSELCGKAHLDKAVARATKSIMALSTITGSTWGATRDQILKLYKAVVIPGMLYACSIWYIPSEERGFKVRKKLVEEALSRL